jgi:AcrR family transcriptional regulator
MTIDQILDAASDVLLAHGIAGLTLTAVTEQAGITKGGLLYHFQTKNDLERRLKRRFAARIEHRLSKLQPGTSGDKRWDSLQLGSHSPVGVHIRQIDRLPPPKSVRPGGKEIGQIDSTLILTHIAPGKLGADTCTT